MKLLITGANGFVGTALCRSLQSSLLPHPSLFGVIRTTDQSHRLPPQVKPIIAKSLLELAARRDILSQVDCVVHLAARVHVMRDDVSDPLSEFRSVNTDATLQVAMAAAQSGVRRFIYLSSIKVNGEGSTEPYTELAKPNPQDPYGMSKWEAEQALQLLAAETGLEVVILRPPLVYGPEVKANFLQLMQLVKQGVPLPLGRVNNARSLVYVGNLVNVILACAAHPAAAGQTFLVSDGIDVSTPELIRSLGTALDCPARLLPIPPEMLKFAGQIMGKSAQVDRLLGSLTIDSRKLRQTLNWQPPFSLQQGLEMTANWYRTTY